MKLPTVCFGLASLFFQDNVDGGFQTTGCHRFEQGLRTDAFTKLPNYSARARII